MLKHASGRKEGSTVADFRSLARTCGGTGWLDCECGGDQCYCTLNGGIDCLGCEDCREYNAYDEGDDWDDDEDPRDAALREPDCEHCGGPANEGFCRVCQ